MILAEMVFCFSVTLSLFCGWFLNIQGQRVALAVQWAWEHWDNIICAVGLLDISFLFRLFTSLDSLHSPQNSLLLRAITWTPLSFWFCYCTWWAAFPCEFMTSGFPNAFMSILFNISMSQQWVSSLSPLVCYSQSFYSYKNRDQCNLGELKGLQIHISIT